MKLFSYFYISLQFYLIDIITCISEFISIVFLFFLKNALPNSVHNRFDCECGAKFIYVKLTYYCLSNTNVPNDFDSSVSVCACESNFSFCLPNTSYTIVTFLPERSQVKTEGLPP